MPKQGGKPEPKRAAFSAATEAYTEWLRAHPPVVDEDFATKTDKMAENPFGFLRGTFYWWAQRFPNLCPRLMQAPKVLGIGDLHVGNFGIWPTDSGDIQFGVNDFDEATSMPYTNDLVRLASSAVIVDGELTAGGAAEPILRGYVKGMEDENPGPFVLSEKGHPKLFDLANRKQKHFWHDLRGKNPLITQDEMEMYEEAVAAADAALPRHVDAREYRRRTAGCGSLGRVRVVVVGRTPRHWVAREAKRLLPSAWEWASEGMPTKGGKLDGNRQDAALLDLARDARDPEIRVPDPYRYVVRRLGPTIGRLPFGEDDHLRDDIRVLNAMGKALGLVHKAAAGSGTEIRTHLRDLGDATWLEDATAIMAADVKDCYMSFRDSE